MLCVVEASSPALCEKKSNQSTEDGRPALLHADGISHISSTSNEEIVDGEQPEHKQFVL